MDDMAAARRIGSLEASVRLPKPEMQSRAPAPTAKLPGNNAQLVDDPPGSFHG